MRMRILYHHRTQGRGSQWVHMISVIRVLESLGFAVDLLSPPGVDPRREAGNYVYAARASKEGPIRLLWRFLSLHAPEIIFELAEVAYNFWALPRLLRHFRRTTVDLVYERYAYFLWAGAFVARWKRVPFIIEVNDVSGFVRTRGQTLLAVAQWVESYLFRTADTILVVSSFLKDSIVSRGVDPNKVLVVPNGVDHVRFNPTNDGAEIRRSWGLEGRVVFGFVGWIAPYDDLPFLINVFEEVYRLRPDAALVLVGDVVGEGPGLDDLRKQIRERSLEKAVVLTGAVAREQMPKVIAAIDVGVIPHSNPCGSPLVLFELMASGKPVIAPDLGPLRDVLTHRKNGLLFPPLDRAAFAKELLRLMETPNLRAEIGAAARAVVLAEHTWEKKVAKILAFHEGRERAAPATRTDG
jgi:glycosyltransferase involved in cell wall biosynthesis